MWLEPPAFQEELNLPLFTILLIPFCITLLLKIFSLGFISLAEQITNRVSWEIIGIGCNSSEMDRDRYSGNCLFKVEAYNEEEEEQKKVLCGGSIPHSSLYEIP